MGGCLELHGLNVESSMAIYVQREKPVWVQKSVQGRIEWRQPPSKVFMLGRGDGYRVTVYDKIDFELTRRIFRKLKVAPLSIQLSNSGLTVHRTQLRMPGCLSSGKCLTGMTSGGSA